MRAMQAELAMLEAGAATMPEGGGEAPPATGGRVTPPGREPGAFDFAMPTAKKRKPTPVQPSLPAALAAPFTVDVEQEPEGTLGDMALKVTAVAVDVDLKVTAVVVDGDAPMELGPLCEHAAAERAAA
ncbi:hypothetical protein AURANDRAFT_64370 [Aureococcus anophagefferens]|uniref:Uncharacterized protein n=1 Tax=Aureococcus anophagefferens TaxID=44056 RepID=F0Y9X6_AURAN|nr:hypothetical protein AURANDRAFT_64370 [Aureococcus anophagefferens]EGB08099.1 hypothetical protein AURANDRAFT_64370 [Aureococcus anophagefferens]|eukprot:XP_009037457.1 hypothetical protein AURANDRAFT_64370 [Aureococcus anophagefferens]